MKTSMHFLLIPAFAALAGSCSNDETLQPEEKQPVVVRATTEYTEVPATRTLFGEPTLDAGGKSYSIPLTWNEDETTEHLDVMGYTLTGAPYDNSFTTFTGVADSRSEDGKSMSFTADAYPGSDIGKYAYFYPSGTFSPQTTLIYNTTGFSKIVLKQSGNNSLAHLPAVNYMYSELAAPGEAFILKPMTAILRFDLTFPAAVTNGTLTLSSDKSSFVSQIRIMCDGTTISTARRSSFTSPSVEIADIPEPTTNLIVYMMTGAPEGGDADQGGATLTLTATMPTEAKTYTTTLGTTKDDARFLPGKCYNFVVSEDKWSVADFI